METKHTPGPWYVQDDHGRRYIETEGNDDTIAEIHRRRNKGSVYSCAEAGANARLIAAAPKMLAALIKLHDSLKQLNDCGDVGRYVEEEVEIARAAIAEATA